MVWLPHIYIDLMTPIIVSLVIFVSVIYACNEKFLLGVIALFFRSITITKKHKKRTDEDAVFPQIKGGSPSFS